MSEISRLCATSRWVRPDLPARACDRRRRWSCGRVEHLVQVHVDRARDRRRSARRAAGRPRSSSPAPRRPTDLHVDRRRQAEVQDLGDDVGRLEEEGQVGEARAAARSRSCFSVAGASARGRASSATRISPSAELIGAPSLSARLMPLSGCRCCRGSSPISSAGMIVADARPRRARSGARSPRCASRPGRARAAGSGRRRPPGRSRGRRAARGPSDQPRSPRRPAATRRGAPSAAGERALVRASRRRSKPAVERAGATAPDRPRGAPCSAARSRCDAPRRAAGSAPSSAPACARGGRTSASRRRPPARAA